MVFVSWLIWLDRSGAALPVFELSPREEMINTWSGFLLPMIAVWIAQWFNARQRNMAVAEAERGVEEVLQSGRQVELKEQQLAALVDEVRLSAGELLQMAGQLENTLAGVRQRCEAIDADSRAQAETSSVPPPSGSIRPAASCSMPSRSSASWASGWPTCHVNCTSASPVEPRAQPAAERTVFRTVAASCCRRGR